MIPNLGKEVSFQRVIDLLGPSVIRVIGALPAALTHPVPIKAGTASAGSFAFCEQTGDLAVGTIQITGAKIIFCCDDPDFGRLKLGGQTLLVLSHPRLCFMRVLRAFFSPTHAAGIHPTASLHPDATVHPSAFIGPNTYVGQSRIGEGAVIYGNVFIYDGTSIGTNVTVHAGSVLGVDGFHFHPNEVGELEKFPHLGGLVIDDEVEIGSHVSISRGTLSDTIIGKGTKFDNLVHIGHTVIIGQRCRIAAGATIAGNVTIGDNVWVGPNAVLSNNINIGNGASITLGSVVASNVKPNQRVSGNFAVDHAQFLMNYARSLRAPIR